MEKLSIYKGLYDLPLICSLKPLLKAGGIIHFPSFTYRETET